MKTINLQQNTTEWEEWRKEKIGASDVAILMCGTDAEIEKLWKQKLGLESPTFESYAMSRGKRLEEVARDSLNQLGLNFSPIICEHEEYEFLTCSLDGYNEDRQLGLEIKCPTTFVKSTKDLHRYNRYLWQVQAQILVAGLKGVILYAYHPDGVADEWIEPNAEMQAKIIEQAKWFNVCVRERVNPAQILEIEDPDIEREVQEAKRLEKQIKEVLENAKKKLIERSGGFGCRCGSITLSKTGASIKTDYRKAALDAGVDLTLYQSETEPSFRMTVR